MVVACSCRNKGNANKTQVQRTKHKEQRTKNQVQSANLIFELKSYIDSQGLSVRPDPRIHFLGRRLTLRLALFTDLPQDLPKFIFHEIFEVPLIVNIVTKQDPFAAKIVSEIVGKADEIQRTHAVLRTLFYIQTISDSSRTVIKIGLRANGCFQMAFSSVGFQNCGDAIVDLNSIRNLTRFHAEFFFESLDIQYLVPCPLSLVPDIN